MADTVADQMTDQRRALLTDREREILSGDADVTDNYRYSVESRVRTRLNDRLAEDVEIIRTMYPEIFDDVVYPIVCEPGEEGEGDDMGQPHIDSSRTPDPGPESQRAVSEQPATLRDRAEAALEELEVPGRAAAVEQTRRRAIMHAWDTLREHGEMKPWRLANDTFGAFFEEPDLDYSTASSRYAGYQMWDNCIRDTLRELPGVHTGSVWRFVENNDA